MSILKLKFKPASDPLAEAEAALEAAAGRRIAAREMIDDAVAAFPIPDRRVIAALSPMFAAPDEGSVEHMRSADDRDIRARRATYDKAVEAERVANIEHDAALQHRNDVRREMEVQAHGDGRQALAAAQAEAVEAVRVADEARAAVAKCRGRLVAVQASHSRVESLLAEARERAIGSEDAVAPLADLRRAEADARDDIAIAAEALRRAEAAFADFEYSERTARDRVLASADDVIAMAAAPAWAEVERARIEVRRREAVFCEIAARIRNGGPADADGLARRRSEIVSFYDSESKRVRAAASYAWGAAHAALLQDPQAELPSLT